MLEEIRKELEINCGIYRDDGCGVIDLPPQGADRVKQKLSVIFRKFNLGTTIEANKKRVEFLVYGPRNGRIWPLYERK